MHAFTGVHGMRLISESAKREAIMSAAFSDGVCVG
jgi:hypothetical protein